MYRVNHYIIERSNRRRLGEQQYIGGYHWYGRCGIWRNRRHHDHHLYNIRYYCDHNSNGKPDPFIERRYQQRADMCWRNSYPYG
jgi:hypothetical protein